MPSPRPHTADNAPLTGYGFYRVGEDGRLYLITKSEHYHAPLGHAFPGYRLLEIARRLGIPNATHNNTRGHITAPARRGAGAAATASAAADDAACRRVLAGRRPVRSTGS